MVRFVFGLKHVRLQHEKFSIRRILCRYLIIIRCVVMSKYLLQVGDKRFDRLKFINDVFGEHSRNYSSAAAEK